MQGRPRELHRKKQTKIEKDVIKTETLSACIIESKTDAPFKLNNEMNCQEGAIAMTTTAATTANKPTLTVMSSQNVLFVVEKSGARHIMILT